MASMSALIPTSSPSISLFQKPMFTTHGSPVHRLPLMSKMGRVRCSMEGNPPILSDDGVKFPVVEGKRSWPELVGVKGELAAAIIKKENPLVHPKVVSVGSPGTQDFGYKRVRVVVNSEGVVVKTPVIG